MPAEPTTLFRLSLKESRRPLCATNRQGVALQTANIGKSGRSLAKNWPDVNGRPMQILIALEVGGLDRLMQMCIDATLVTRSTLLTAGRNGRSARLGVRE